MFCVVLVVWGFKALKAGCNRVLREFEGLGVFRIHGMYGSKRLADV